MEAATQAQNLRVPEYSSARPGPWVIGPTLCRDSGTDDGPEPHIASSINTSKHGLRTRQEVFTGAGARNLCGVAEASHSCARLPFACIAPDRSYVFPKSEWSIDPHETCLVTFARLKQNADNSGQANTLAIASREAPAPHLLDCRVQCIEAVERTPGAFGCGYCKAERRWDLGAVD